LIVCCGFAIQQSIFASIGKLQQDAVTEQVKIAVDASLKRLPLDYIDLYQLHGFNPLTPFEESLSALNDLVRSGRVRYIGLCNMSAWHIMKALGISDRRGWARFVRGRLSRASLQGQYRSKPPVKD